MSFVATHEVPDGGLNAFERPDAALQPVAVLDPRLPVMVLARSGDWAQVRCSNGWEAWVNADALCPLPEILDVLSQSLNTYRGLVDDLATGRLDEHAFHRQALGVGLVVRDGVAWLLDLPSQRWWRYDGVQLSPLSIAESAKEA